MIQRSAIGFRALAFGDSTSRSGTLELRFIDANVDMVAGDLLTTSGVDGVYPPGLPVARVLKIERRADSAFARITCAPVAGVAASLHVLVLHPLAEKFQPRPVPDPAPARKGGKL